MLLLVICFDMCILFHNNKVIISHYHSTLNIHQFIKDNNNSNSINENDIEQEESSEEDKEEDGDDERGGDDEVGSVRSDSSGSRICSDDSTIKKAVKMLEGTTNSSSSSGSSSGSDSSEEGSMEGDLVRVHCYLLLFTGGILVHLVFSLSQLMLFIH